MFVCYNNMYCWHACVFHNVVLNEISTTTSVYEVNVESDNYMYYVVSSIGNVDRYHEFR